MTSQKSIKGRSVSSGNQALKRICIHIAFLASCFAAAAQDPHFSQYGNLPLYLNPALTGHDIEHVRMTAVYRNQWPGITSPYTTEGIFVDKKVGRFGFGLQVFKNGAGEASIQRLDAGGMLAYHLPLGREGALSGGLQVGMMNKKFNPDKLSFDNQYIEDTGFDPALPHGEVFANTSITRPDLTFGLLYKHGFHNPKATFKPFGGVSFAHLNRPDEVFISGDIRLPIRQTYHAGAGIRLNKSMELRPMALYMMQESFSEFYTGATLAFLTSNANAFQAGMFLRNSDAAIAYAGFQVNRLFVGTSYDFNISSLNEASGGHGALELTVSYTFKKRHKGKPTDPAEIIVKAPVKKKKIRHLARREQETLALGVTAPEHLEGRNVLSPAVGDEQPVLARKTPAKPVQPEPQQEQETRLADTPVESMTTRESAKLATTGMPGSLGDRRSRTPDLPSIREESPGINKIDTRTEEVPVQEPNQLPATKPVMASTGIRIDETPVVKSLVDSDGDGISDANDECPFIKGDIGTRGCPDTDKDGVVDMKDRCPMEPGTASNRGCPETEPAFAKAMLIRNFSNIEFETGKAVVRTHDLYDIVEHAIDILYANPESRIILTGHTDSEGDDLFNMTLSLNRTVVVSQYLQRQGIAPARIQMVNYGETMPLMDNSDEYGKARNRRVEINIVRN